MKGYEITRQLRDRRSSDHQFIKWWRKENDFLDYDLIDRYNSNFSDSEDIQGFELLTTEQMWNELKRVCGNRLSRKFEGGMEYIQWQPPEGGQQRKECLFTPQALIDIFDRETRGNPIDS